MVLNKSVFFSISLNFFSQLSLVEVFESSFRESLDNLNEISGNPLTIRDHLGVKFERVVLPPNFRSKLLFVKSVRSLHSKTSIRSAVREGSYRLQISGTQSLNLYSVPNPIRNPA